jgi:hypothetical protein
VLSKLMWIIQIIRACNTIRKSLKKRKTTTTFNALFLLNN